jgi:hypothetical protein
MDTTTKQESQIMYYSETVLLNITYEHGLHISSDWFDFWISYPVMILTMSLVAAGIVWKKVSKYLENK